MAVVSKQQKEKNQMEFATQIDPYQFSSGIGYNSPLAVVVFFN
jgi:hypothetical protein